MQIFCFYKGYCVLLQIEGDFEVDAAAGEVIGAGPLVSVGIGNPEIGVDVIPAYDIESLELQGPLLNRLCLLGGDRLNNTEYAL